MKLFDYCGLTRKENKAGDKAKKQTELQTFAKDTVAVEALMERHGTTWNDTE